MNFFEKIIQYFVIIRSGFFDKDFYLQTYPEIHDSVRSPITHYITQGWKENRDPGPSFSTSWYLKTYPDVREANINPLYHYLKYGKKEGRQVKKLPKVRQIISQDSKDKSVDFLIIGAQRAGTTSLFKFLDLLPPFCGSIDKEIGYFSIDRKYENGFEWYHKQFKFCYPGQLACEATPEYLYYPFVPARVKKYKGDLRFIVLLRDPVERCYSAWRLFRNIYYNDPLSKEGIIKASEKTTKNDLAKLMKMEEYPDFHTAVTDDLDRFYQNSNIIEPSFVRRGLYHTQLTHWLKHFNMDDFLFFEIRELNQPEELLEKIQNFLGVNFDFTTNKFQMPEYNKLSRKMNANINAETLNLLRDFYHEPNIRLFSLINKTYDWNVNR